METKNTETTTIHPFDTRGLGKAPFRFVGMVHQDIAYGQAVVSRADGVTTKPGGTCAYCGTYILQMFGIASTDGRRFHVGADCVERVAAKGTRLLADVQRAARKLKTTQAHARQDATIAAGRAALATEALRAAMAAQPHPTIATRTLLDWAEWMMANAGRAGRVKAAKVAIKFA